MTLLYLIVRHSSGKRRYTSKKQLDHGITKPIPVEEKDLLSQVGDFVKPNPGSYESQNSRKSQELSLKMKLTNFITIVRPLHCL